jgi:hypothetical protein
MVDLEAALSEHLLEVAVAEWIRYQVTACTISHASKCRPLTSSVDWRFSFSAMAFRIIGTLHNIGSGNFPADGQQLVNHENLRQGRKKTLQFRLSKQERAIDTRRKVLIGALVLHRLENGDHASSSRPFLEWLQRELPKFLVREGDRELFDDLLKPHGEDQSSTDRGAGS